VEVELAGPTLDRHGYLVDIVDVEAHLDELVAYYRDRILNGLPEFSGLNPSIENFCRIFCGQMADRLVAPHLSALTVRIWEADIAWAAYRRNL
jgi:6-pyruvoyltetrahydropterin/6-carboxytetrahydropterin synthase